jgi:nitroimidazol reductase NimA-like FMN-containing flavoprotein (pyridoxamine 5'-phosphate oxidase superfamily)
MGLTVIETVKKLLFGQRLAVLATVCENRPYTSIVGFAAEPDMKTLYFGTPQATLKVRNISNNPAVSLLIDNRQNAGGDFSLAFLFRPPALS